MATKAALRLLLQQAAQRQWQLRSMDIKAAYLQGRRLGRVVFVQPPPEAGEPDGTVWRLETGVYGLCDAARVWYKVCAVLEDAGCRMCTSDPAVFTYHKGGVHHGAFLAHVDDFAWTGSSVFERDVQRVRDEFRVGSEDESEHTRPKGEGGGLPGRGPPPPWGVTESCVRLNGVKSTGVGTLSGALRLGVGI